MGAYSLSYGLSRIVSGEVDILIRPRDNERGRRGVVILPGQLQTPLDWNKDTNPNQQSVFRSIASASVPGVVIDAGVASWGNDTAVADIELARAYLSNFNCAVDKIVLIGASAGALDAFNYARAHPDRVAAIVGIMPASDLDDIRDNNRAGTGQANVNTAWGMPVGSTSATDPLPARANPNTTTNAALIVSSGAPIKMYYSTADTVVIPATVTSLAAKLGITPTIISTTTDHSDALFADVPANELCQFIDALI